MNLTFRKSEFRIFLLLALSGLILRGLYLFEYAHFVNFDLAVGADVGEYHTRAGEILKGIFFPVTPDIHAPLYSFFLAGLQKIALDIPGIRIFQTLLNFFSWTGIYFLLRDRGFPEKCSLVFFGISMFLAPLIFHPAELISESLLLPLLTVVFFSFHYAEKKEQRFSLPLFGTLAGFFAALALLCHGIMAGYLVLQSAYLIFRKKWRLAIFFLLGIFILVPPFIIAQSCHYGKFTGIQANSGFNIFLGNNKKATGLCYMRPGNHWRKTHFQANTAAQKRQISTDRYFLEKVFDFWKKYPLQGLSLCIKKSFLIFSGKDHIAGADGGFLFCRTNTINLLRFLTFPCFLLSFYGLWSLFREKKFYWTPPLLLCFSLFLMQIMTVTSGRYRLMMFPGLIYLAALGAVNINWKKWSIPVFFLFAAVIWKTYSFVGTDKAEGTALLGQGHFIKGNYVHAKELLVFARKRFRDSSRIENMLGNIAEKEGRLEQARKHYSKVVKDEPFMPEGWMNLANITPDVKSADRLYFKALEAAGNSPSADLTYNYAKYLYAVKRYTEVEKYLDLTFQKDPDHVMALNLSGLTAAEKKDFRKASEFFFKAACLNPREPGFWKNTAITARMAGNKKLENKAAQEYLNLLKEKNK